MAKLLYQGHGSYRLTTDAGVVIYIDPFAGKGYDLPADIILVTHQHRDHNQIELVAKKKDCLVISNQEALKNGKYQNFSIKGIQIDAVPAYNKNHKREESVGYVLSLDRIKIYASGDTSTTEEMKTLLPGYHLDYAVLPIDGFYNMDAKEASFCASLIGAKHTIPIHMKPGALFDRTTAETFDAPNRLIVEPSQEIEL
jgi:L-ascorbate metabolism protein UlaG (beta-lactamase superfamily)